MKWQQRVRVRTGLSCWQIVLHFAVAAALFVGWKDAILIPVGIGLCLFYVAAVIMMLLFQRFQPACLRDIGDFLEEMTTTWYAGSAMIALWLLSRMVQSHLVLVLAGLAILAGPVLYSLLVKDKSGNIAPDEQPVRR